MRTVHHHPRASTTAATAVAEKPLGRNSYVGLLTVYIGLAAIGAYEVGTALAAL